MKNSYGSENKRDIDQYKSTLTEVSKNVLFHEKYQKILFILYFLSAFFSLLTLAILPSQKHLPSFICLDNTDNKDILDYLLNYKSLNVNESNLNTTQSILETKDSKIHGNLLKKIEDIEIIQNNEKCILKYCYSAKEKNKTFSEINKSIVVNYDSVYNYVTRFDAFCDYDDFFTLLTILIISGRIIGNLLYSYLADRYGSLRVFKFNLIFNLLLYVAVLIFDSRIILYVFHFGSSLDLSLYLLVVAISSENIHEKYLSILKNRISYLFSFLGLLSIFIMSQLADFRILFIIEIILIVIILNYTNTYLLENFSYLINNNLLDESYKNFLFLIHLIEINLENNESLSKDICRIERFTKNSKKLEEKRSQSIKMQIELSDFELKSNKINSVEQESNKNPVLRKLTSCEVNNFRNNFKINKNEQRSICDKKNKNLKKSCSLNTPGNNANDSYFKDKSYENDTSRTETNFIDSKNNNNNNNSKFRSSNCKRVQFYDGTNFLENSDSKSYLRNTINNINLRKTENKFKNKFNSLFEKYMKPVHGVFSNDIYRKFVCKAIPLYLTVNLVFYGLFYKLENLIENVYLSNFIFLSGELAGKFYSAYAFSNSERKRVIFFALIVNSFLFFLSFFSDYYFFRAFVLFFATFLITIMHEGINLLLSESFENDIRNNLTMSLSLFSNLSLLLFILFIGQNKYMLLAFFFLCLVAIFSLKMQRETYKKDAFLDNSLELS